MLSVILILVGVLAGQSIGLGKEGGQEETTTLPPSAEESKQIVKKQDPTKKSGRRTTTKTAKKFTGLKPDSFRIIVPPIGQSKLEGLDDYSYRLTVPSDNYL